MRSIDRPHVIPETSGASETACRIINAIWSLDGFAVMRADDSYVGFVARLARLVDRELRQPEGV